MKMTNKRKTIKINIEEPITERKRDSKIVDINFDELFSGWPTARIEIKTILDNFGIYIRHEKEDPFQVYISFIPFEKINLIPEPHLLSFIRIYNIFSSWFFQKANMQTIIDKYLNNVINCATIQSLTYDIETLIRKYEYENGVRVEEILRACFGLETGCYGLPAIFILPDDLKNLLIEAKILK
jgi:hypothetical protein